MRRLLALLLASGTVALANERLPVTHVRFSVSGDRVLVLTSGVKDGSGQGAARLDVLSTAGGTTLYRQSRTADASPGSLRAALLNAPATAARLHTWGLWPGRVHAARFARTYAAPYPRWSDAATSGQTERTAVNVWSRPVPVTLDVYALPSTCAYPEMLGGFVPAGFRLSVNGLVVFQDAALPAARACAAGYTLERVDVQGDRALLTVRAYGPGFEGPDAEPVFIAATLR
ncbi:putative secreted protein [Deinococcus metalli]|uniref:Putative secreted protein n=1 Tax=Deinococcus metalli TaxID=1141878 RepID=A0A7W8NQP9_9DEIO|nr:DUF2259 domain-containing protein [Deinococcus metalli]MBB5377045.1 putative secreted protein [Deinococcus metalli]GHF49344.1 hypothetical protein GCM10017781_27300 [Deinococcus metalli]